MRIKTGALLLFVLMISCLVPIAISSPVQAAQGDVAWTRTLPTAYSSGTYDKAGVITHGDGTVTATACGSVSNLDDTQSMTLSPNNDVLGNVTGLNQGAVCMNRGVAGIDGMLFYSEQLTSPLNVTKLVVVKNGVQVASHSITYQCSVPFGTTYYGIPSGMKIGADGNLYAIVIRQSCTSTPNLLVSLDGRTGQIRFQQPLTYGNTYQGNNTIGVYDSGVVIAEDNVSTSYPDLLSYFSYAGNKNDTLSCAIDSATDSCGFSYGGSSIGSIRTLLTKPDGTAYVEAWGGTCGSRKTFKYTVSGVASSVTRPTSCSELLKLMPNDYLVFYDGSSAIVTDSSGTTQYSGALGYKPGYTFIRAPYSSEILIDGYGNVVVLRYARPTSATTARHLYIDKLNPGGMWSTLFSTEQLSNPSGSKFYFDYAYDVPNVAFAKNYMYLAVCRAACDSTNGPMLSKVSMPGMEVEYPRSEIFAEYAADNGAQLNYVALGDSYSAGEGNAPYVTGTDTSGPPENRCHRSTTAYPFTLDADSQTDLNLRHFRACSGATTTDVIQGMNGEPGQLDFIDADTDVVSLTIGGNDVGFKTFATACTIGACGMNTQPYSDTMSAITSDLPASLENLYGQILDKNSSLTLYVIGYPYVTPEVAPTTSECWPFNEAANNPDPATGDSAAAYNVVANLNSVIQTKVAGAALAYGPTRIKYVDPNVTTSAFPSHDWCSSDPYFTVVHLFNNTEHSYHPDSRGIGEYAALLKGAL